MHGRWLFCPTCGSPIDQDSYRTAIEKAKINAASHFYRDPDVIEEAIRLLEACRQMRREWGAFGKVTQETLMQVDAAIAKASELIL